MSDPSDIDDLPVLSSRRPKSRSWTSSLLSNALRLSIWYLIITILFRCPASPADVTSSSPRICQSYVDVKTRIDPYARPYYEKYATPYVAAVQPFAESFNRKVFAPATSFAIAKYEKHAAPRVAQAKEFGEKEWQRTIRPQVEKVEEVAFSQYKANVEPFVLNAEKAVHPHVENARKVALWQYEHKILPWYRRILPQLQDLYIRSERVASENIIPRIKLWANLSSRFIMKKIWPSIRIVYGRNVEPQLSKIRERLGSYTDSKKLEAEIENIDQRQKQAETHHSFGGEEPPTQVNSLSQIPTESSTLTTTAVEAQATVEDFTEPLVDELKLWQEKFARASDKGAEDLSQRIADIAAREIDSQCSGVGQAHLTRLEEASSTAIEDLKTAILQIVNGLETQDDEPAKVEEALEEGKEQVRHAARTIKEKAQTLRLWRLGFLDELDTLVNAATSSTLEVLDHVRNLGLQEIGLRWAKLDELVTHQDWKEYHNMKKSFTEWRSHVEKVASQHEGLVEAQKRSEEVEEQGMAIAEDAANELSRLKDVVVWKIELRDSTDDFSTKTLPLKARKLGQQILEKASDVREAVAGSSTAEGSVQSLVSKASELFEDTFDSPPDEVLEQVQAITSSILSTIQEAVGDTVESLTESDNDDVEKTLASTLDSSSTATSVLSSMVEDAIEFVHQASTVASSIAATVTDSKSDSDVESTASSVIKSASQTAPAASGAGEAEEESTSTSTTTSTVTYTVSLESLTDSDHAEATVAFAPDTFESLQDPIRLEKVSEAVEEAIEMVIESSASAAASAASAASEGSASISSAATSEVSIASSLASELSTNLATAAASGVSKASSLAKEGGDSLSSQKKKRRSSSSSAASRASKAAKSGSNYASAKAKTLSSDIVDGIRSASTSLQSELSEARESASSTTKSLRMLADLD